MVAGFNPAGQISQFAAGFPIGVAGGAGYGFGIRYGFEKLFAAFNQQGAGGAFSLLNSDLSELLNNIEAIGSGIVDEIVPNPKPVDPPSPNPVSALPFVPPTENIDQGASIVPDVQPNIDEKTIAYSFANPITSKLEHVKRTAKNFFDHQTMLRFIWSRHKHFQSKAQRDARKGNGASAKKNRKMSSRYLLEFHSYFDAIKEVYHKTPKVQGFN